MKSEIERPRGMNPNEIIALLLNGRVTPAGATRSIRQLFERQGLTAEEGYQRVIDQHNVFADSNEQMPQVQGVRWDNFVICMGQSLEISKERIIRERIVPVGTPSVREDLEDLAF